MRELTEEELRELTDRYRIDVDGAELETVLEMTNSKLQGLEELYEVTVADGTRDRGERTWHEPEDDPHRALVAVCDVPPKTENSGDLAGVDVGVKDLVAVAGVPMQCGSGVMRGYVPDFDAAVIDRLRGAGANIAAKTNLDEFAGSGRGISFRGQMTNPYDENRASGGSSGGSAIAVATDQVDVALGTDTGGSIRLPSSYCGVVGVKPTYGLVPLHGVVENTYTTDHVGPMTESVADAAKVLSVLAGSDRRDPASMQAAGRDDYRIGDIAGATANAPDPAELRIGVLEEGQGRGAAEQSVDDRIVDRTEAVADDLADAGATIERPSLPDFELAQPVKFAMSLTELAAHWRAGGAPFRRGGVVDEGYQLALSRRGQTSSAELNAHYRARILAGARLIEGHHGRHYARALAAREALRETFAETAAAFDALLLPTAPNRAPTLEDVENPVTSTARNTIPANVTGQPAVSLPAGDIEGIPVGVQLVGSSFRDDHLLSVAKAVETVASDR